LKIEVKKEKKKKKRKREREREGGREGGRSCALQTESCRIHYIGKGDQRV
jgi:hypothetical protein